MSLAIIKNLLLEINPSLIYWDTNWINLDMASKAILYGYRSTKYTSYRYSKLSKTLFPDKPKGIYPKTFLLAMFNKKHCTSCDTILDVHNFRKNRSKTDGLNAECKECHCFNSGKTQPARTAKYRSNKLKATPIWAELVEISSYYNSCPEGYHVDHIIPLQGDLVCGLHVLCNLQYLTVKDNIEKGNKFEV